MINIQLLEDVIFYINSTNASKREKELIIEKVTELYPQKEYTLDDEKEKARQRRISEGKERKRLRNLHEISFDKTRENEEHIERIYNSSRRSLAKRQANKQLRQYHGPIDNGACYRIITDYKNILW